MLLLCKDICKLFVRFYLVLMLFIGIKYMYAEPNGTKIAFIDTKNQGYIYSPVTDALILVREIPAR